MDKEYKATVFHSGNGLCINLPKAIRKRSNILQGDTLTIHEWEDRLVIPLYGILRSAKTLGWTLRVKGTKPATASSNAKPNKPESPKGKDDPS